MPAKEPTNFSTISRLLFLAFFFLLPSDVEAEDEFAVFDGRVYNGKFYPRVDIIEWSEEKKATHMEFHVFSKTKPVDMAFELETKTGKPVMLVKYFMKDRGEYVCRRVLAPGHFTKNQPLFIYMDKTDGDFDNTLISNHKLEENKSLVLLQSPKPYTPCEDPKDPSKDRAVASDLPEMQSVKTTEVPNTTGGLLQKTTTKTAPLHKTAEPEEKSSFADW